MIFSSCEQPDLVLLGYLGHVSASLFGVEAPLDEQIESSVSLNGPETYEPTDHDQGEDANRKRSSGKGRGCRRHGPDINRKRMARRVVGCVKHGDDNLLNAGTVKREGRFETHAVRVVPCIAVPVRVLARLQIPVDTKIRERIVIVVNGNLENERITVGGFGWEQVEVALLKVRNARVHRSNGGGGGGRIPTEIVDRQHDIVGSNGVRSEGERAVIGGLSVDRPGTRSHGMVVRTRCAVEHDDTVDVDAPTSGNGNAVGLDAGQRWKNVVHGHGVGGRGLLPGRSGHGHGDRLLARKRPRSVHGRP